jgi:hypothetical protein
MTLRHFGLVAISVAIIANNWLSFAARGQNAPPGESSVAHDESQNAARRQILESARWQQANRTLNEWFSVQHIYRPEQVANIRAELTARIAKMPPRELEDFLKDLEERLQVLLSPEAEDARLWLGQFLAVAVNPERQLGRSLPDVLNMSASEIRQELRWLEQHRAQRQRSQAAFNQTRAAQVQSARGVQRSRQPAATTAPNRAAQIANRPAYRSQYSPQRELQPAPLGPLYKIGPWGTPVYWHPQNPWW